MSFLGNVGDIDLRASVYSASLFVFESRLENALGVFQNDVQKRDSYSFFKGMTSLTLKCVFYPLAALCALVEGVVRIILAGIAWLGSWCVDGGQEVSRNLLDGAIVLDRPDTELTAIKVFLIGLAVPLSDFFGLIYKTGEVCCVCRR